MPSLNLSKLVRRDPDRASPQERAAELKTTVARVTRCEPQRRDLLRGAGAALTGVIVGAPVYRTGRDLSAVAEAWLEDAKDLGILVLQGPDGDLWRVEPINDGEERAVARDRHWFKLNDRPTLMRAVRRAVRQGVQPWADVELARG